MKARLILLWQARSDRERRLLALLGAIALPLLVWLALVRPLIALGAHQARIRADADTGLADVQAMAYELDALRAGRGRPLDGPLPVAIRGAAEQAGFAAARVEPQGEGRVLLGIDAVRPQPLFGWLARMQARGIVVESLNARPNGDATLAVSISLRRADR